MKNAALNVRLDKVVEMMDCHKGQFKHWISVLQKDTSGNCRVQQTLDLLNSILAEVDKQELRVVELQECFYERSTENPGQDPFD